MIIMDMRLPEEFEKRMQAMLADEYDDFIQSFEGNPYKGLRLNPLKLKDKLPDMADRLAGMYKMTPVTWCETGFYYDDTLHPGSHPYHEAGLYYIQEPSAMLPGELAGIVISRLTEERGYVRVLDMCAAPGGKATHIASAIGSAGILIANEPVASRAAILSQNIERMGISRCMVCSELPERLAGIFPGYFDVVITDVPCSGEGMFRKNETAIAEWSAENVKLCADRSQTIMEAAHTCLKSDGYMIYSTCTYEPEENEEAVAGFMASHPEYHIVNICDEGRCEDISRGCAEWLTSDASDRIRDELHSTCRIWPHKAKGEGHFAAVLRKGDRSTEETAYIGHSAKGHDMTGDTDSQAKGLCIDRSVSHEAVGYLNEFMDDALTDKGREFLSGRLFAFGSNLYIAPEDIAQATMIKGLRIERAGLHIGVIKKGRMEPAHSLVMALSPDMCKRSVDIGGDSEAAVRYIAGESLPCDDGMKGYAAVTVDGYTIGWGKASGGILKNHYPKGIRRNLAAYAHRE